MTEFDTRWQQELATPKSNLTKGRTVELENGAYFSGAPLSLGEPAFLSVEGKGTEQSVIIAAGDYGENQYVMGSRSLNDFMLGVSPSSPGKVVKVSSWSDAISRSTGGLVSNPSRIPGAWL